MSPSLSLSLSLSVCVCERERERERLCKAITYYIECMGFGLCHCVSSAPDSAADLLLLLLLPLCVAIGDSSCVADWSSFIYNDDDWGDIASSSCLLAHCATSIISRGVRNSSGTVARFWSVPADTPRPIYTSPHPADSFIISGNTGPLNNSAATGQQRHVQQLIIFFVVDADRDSFSGRRSCTA